MDIDQADELYSDGPAVDPPDLHPLKPLQMAFYGVIYRFTHPAGRDRLELRRELTLQRRAERAAMAVVRKQVMKESRWFAEIIITTWERLRYYHRSRSDFDTPTSTKKGRKQRIKFEFVVCSDLEIYFKIKTRRRGFFKYKSELPHGVRVLDLINEETLEELSLSCDRKVIQLPTDYSEGVWIVVQRLKGMDGIPGKVYFSHAIKYLKGDPGNAPIILGVGQHRIIHTINLAEFPHMLIGGSAGSGKSNIVNVLICTLMRNCLATDTKFILIDLKMGMEFNFYRNAVHLERPVVTDEQGAVEVLQAAYSLMQQRMKILSEADCKKISEWNERHPDRPMHRLFIVIDEWAEIALSRTKGIPAMAQNLVARISNLGRAPGVHLILCTQRPSTEIVPNSIKINMPLIIAGRVQSHAQNSVILNSGRADELPKITGRMIYETGQDSIAIQTPYITDADIVYSIQIARGRAAGVIDLADMEPVINADGLIRWLALRGGKVSRERGAELREHAISPVMWRNFVQALERDGRLVRRHGGHWLADMPAIIETLSLPEPTMQPANEDDTQPTRPQLAAPAATKESEPPAAPARVIEVLTLEEVLQRFVSACCVFSTRAKATTESLYKAYDDWCMAHDYRAYETIQEFTVKLGRAFPELERTKIRENGKQVRGFAGITLKTTETTETTNATETTKSEDIAA